MVFLWFLWPKLYSFGPAIWLTGSTSWPKGKRGTVVQAASVDEFDEFDEFRAEI